jgi:hypothetical protein
MPSGTDPAEKQGTLRAINSRKRAREREGNELSAEQKAGHKAERAARRAG